MTVASPVRAYTQPLDQQDGSPLLHLPSPMFPERKPGAVLAEGLRMSPKKLPDTKPSDDQSPGAARRRASPLAHLPVMLEEVIDMFAGVPEGVVLDATVGGGGHAFALLTAFPQPKGRRARPRRRGSGRSHVGCWRRSGLERRSSGHASTASGQSLTS